MSKNVITLQLKYTKNIITSVYFLWQKVTNLNNSDLINFLNEIKSL